MIPRRRIKLDAALRALQRQLQSMDDRMTSATDALNAKIDDLTSAVTDALSMMEGEVETIKANAPATDDSDVVNASASRIGTLSQTIRDAMTKAKSDLATASTAAAGTSTAAAPASASTAPAVALAGVPVTPASEGGHRQAPGRLSRASTAT